MALLIGLGAIRWQRKILHEPEKRSDQSGLGELSGDPPRALVKLVFLPAAALLAIHDFPARDPFAIIRHDFPGARGAGREIGLALQ